MLLHWLKAFRLRTLPLSFSTIIMGNALALFVGYFDIEIFVFTLLTTLFLQILSNLANDYGDGVKGTDNANRLGPTRALQSGNITVKQIKIGIVVCTALALISGLYLVLYAVQFENNLQLIFIALGVGAILAAIKYTVGKSAYGYHGLGDAFVFIFFGLVGVGGSFFLQTQFTSLLILLPAISMGCLSSAVLNLNNMRDIENDAAMQKNTLVVMLGLKKAKIYHYSLFIVTYLSLIAFILLIDNQQSSLQIALSIGTGLIIIPHLKHIQTVAKARDYHSFDPELKKIALSTALLSLIWLVAIIYFNKSVSVL